MELCLICQQSLRQPLSIRDVLYWRTIKPALICDTCEAQFLPIESGSSCSQCGRQQDSRTACYDCERWQQMPDIQQITNHALFQYNEMMHDYMHSYKFNGDLRLADIFQEQLTLAILACKVDVIVPVPVSKTTLDIRGFNQARALLPVKIISSMALVVADVSKSQQSKKGRQERMMRQQPFVSDPEKAAEIKGKKILIFDDVYTTGRTLHFAAQALQALEPASVAGLTLAR